MASSPIQVRRRTSRWRRFAAGSTILLAGAVTAVASAPAPAGAHFVAVPPQIAATFNIGPAQGPVGTEITYHGICGFAASNVSLSLTDDPTAGTVVALALQVPIKPTPLGAFNLKLKVPATAVLGGTPVTPGTYYAHAACNFLSPSATFLTPDGQPFEVVPGCRLCVREA